jgi:hypothetical protein
MQLPFEDVHGRCVQEAEGHRAFLAGHGVVHAVGLVQALQVAAARHVAEGPALVHQAVVGHEIQETVGCHAGADPFQRMMAQRGAGVDEGDRHAGEHDGVQVVLLEPAGARFVVRAVPRPAEAVHHVLVGHDGKHFHQDHGKDENEGVGYHNASLP